MIRELKLQPEDLPSLKKRLFEEVWRTAARLQRQAQKEINVIERLKGIEGEEEGWKKEVERGLGRRGEEVERRRVGEREGRIHQAAKN